MPEVLQLSAVLYEEEDEREAGIDLLGEEPGEAGPVVGDGRSAVPCVPGDAVDSIVALDAVDLLRLGPRSFVLIDRSFLDLKFWQLAAIGCVSLIFLVLDRDRSRQLRPS